MKVIWVMSNVVSDGFECGNQTFLFKNHCREIPGEEGVFFVVLMVLGRLIILGNKKG